MAITQKIEQTKDGHDGKAENRRVCPEAARTGCQAFTNRCKVQRQAGQQQDSAGDQKRGVELAHDLLERVPQISCDQQASPKKTDRFKKLLAIEFHNFERLTFFRPFAISLNQWFEVSKRFRERRSSNRR